MNDTKQQSTFVYNNVLVMLIDVALFVWPQAGVGPGAYQMLMTAGPQQYVAPTGYYQAPVYESY